MSHAKTIVHCNENPIFVFLFWELGGISCNFHIHVSVSDLCIPRIGPHISYSRIGRSIVGIYKSLTDTWMRKWPRNSFSGNICFEFVVLGLCSVYQAIVVMLMSAIINTTYCNNLFYLNHNVPLLWVPIQLSNNAAIAYHAWLTLVTYFLDAPKLQTNYIVFPSMLIVHLIF